MGILIYETLQRTVSRSMRFQQLNLLVSILVSSVLRPKPKILLSRKKRTWMSSQWVISDMKQLLKMLRLKVIRDFLSSQSTRSLRFIQGESNHCTRMNEYVSSKINYSAWYNVTSPPRIRAYTCSIHMKMTRREMKNFARKVD